MIGHTDGSVLNDDSERPGRGSRTLAGRARCSSSRSQPVAVEARRPDPDELRPDRTRELEVIPNTPPDGQVGVVPGTVGVAGVAVAQGLGRDAATEALLDRLASLDTSALVRGKVAIGVRKLSGRTVAA